MSAKLKYFYAKVNITSRECTGVFTSSEKHNSDIFYEYVPLDSYISDYIGKYYINDQWYEDADGTIPWSPEE